jgi:hypothetical protein
LNAVPDGEKVSRLETLRNTAKELEEASEQDGSSPEPLNTPLPNIEGAEYLVALLHEAGTVGQGGMGIVPLSWMDIQSWIVVTGRDNLVLWEKGMIKRMSEAYSGAYSRGSEKNSKAPYGNITESDMVRNRDMVAAKAYAIFAPTKSIQVKE